jgi:uncharacterized membrane protein
MAAPIAMATVRVHPKRLIRSYHRFLHLIAILLIATGLRIWGLNGSSLWYDEVVTMRVARAGGPIALFVQLEQIDGTRAPLHPLVLQAWLLLLGSSDLAGRSFSALCGLATVAVIYALGRLAFDETTGRWAAWLAAVCPPLVYYSQEARMYAWLVLLSCLSWLVFLLFRNPAKPAMYLLYWLLLTSLVYSHPLGLFMITAHALAYLLVRSSLKLSLRSWLAIHVAVLIAIAPWLGHFMDHGTDYPMPRHPIRFLLAVPIEYIGGNSWVLAICVLIVIYGLFSAERTDGRFRLTVTHPTENVAFVTWAILPPVLMYIYSELKTPIFGPARYHLYIAPAYLILLAHGLMRLPRAIRLPAVAGALLLSLALLRTYSQAIKADWRGLAAWLRTHEAQAHVQDSPERATIVIHPSDPRFPREQVEAARYYLSPPFSVVLAGESRGRARADQRIYEVECLSRSDTVRDSEPGAPAFFGLRIKN